MIHIILWEAYYLALEALAWIVGWNIAVLRLGCNVLSLHGRCTGGILREKNEASRPFSKVDEVDVYPYHLGEMEFGS